MNRKWTYLTMALVLVLSVGLSAGCQKLRARDRLNQGVQAYKSARFSDAVEKFKEAVDLDPTFKTARLYLGMAYYQQFIPGAKSPENTQMLEAAKEQFQKVLEMDPRDTIALASMASANYNETQGIEDLDKKFAKLDEARSWYDKLAKVDPRNKEAYYTMGVIAWGKWYPILQKARVESGMRQEDPGPLKDKKKRDELRAKYLEMINEGIANLKKALDIDPKYDESMAYLNLLYRERADLADTPDEYRTDIAQADDWLAKTLATRKEKASASGNALGQVTTESGK